jgi:protein tyrosine/serine phosphatase
LGVVESKAVLFPAINNNNNNDNDKSNESNSSNINQKYLSNIPGKQEIDELQKQPYWALHT